MPYGYGKIDLHDFYCTSCGKKNLPCIRPQAHRREAFHLKKLWCYHCRKEVNHVEIKTEGEREQFLKDFRKGKYLSEGEDN